MIISIHFLSKLSTRQWLSPFCRCGQEAHRADTPRGRGHMSVELSHRWSPAASSPAWWEVLVAEATLCLSPAQCGRSLPPRMRCPSPRRHASPSGRPSLVVRRMRAVEFLVSNQGFSPSPSWVPASALALTHAQIHMSEPCCLRWDGPLPLFQGLRAEQRTNTI